MYLESEGSKTCPTKEMGWRVGENMEQESQKECICKTRVLQKRSVGPIPDDLVGLLI